MQSLDEFYKYIEKQEQALRAQKSVAENPTSSFAPASDRDAATPEPVPSCPGSSAPGAATAASRVAGGRPSCGPPAPDEMTAPDYLPPLIEAEPPRVVDAPARHRDRGGTNGAVVGETPSRPLTENEAAALWRRLPCHVQLLVGMGSSDADEPENEVARKYYLKGFKETRVQLIERLLDPTLNLENTARLLGVCPTTVRRYTNRGVLPHHRTAGQQRRFRLSDVLAFLETSRGAGGNSATGNEHGG